MKRQRDPYLRDFRRLKREFPNHELDELWKMAGLEVPSTEPPAWADGRASPKPAFFRNDPRGRR